MTEKVDSGQGNKNNSHCAQSTLFDLDKHKTSTTSMPKNAREKQFTS